MGEIPQRSVFAQQNFQKHLAPYLTIVNCVKQGDMEKFKQILSHNAKLYAADKNLTLV